MKHILLFCLCSSLAGLGFSQTISLSGQVTDSLGSPLNNFPVSYHALNNQSPVDSGMVLTDANGNYQANVNAAPDSSTSLTVSWNDCQGGQGTAVYFGSPNLVHNIVACTVNPTCDPSFNIQSGFGPLDVVISLNQVSFFSNYEFDMGDGVSYNSGTSVTHTYFLPGTYNICVVANGASCSDTVCQTITVGNSSNCTALYQSQSIPGTNTANFTNTSAPAGATPSYQWDFGDGSTDTTFSPSHTFPTAGTYTVCLILSTSASCADTFCSPITVGLPACTASFLSSFPQGDTMSFTAFANGMAPFTFAWDFGNGQTDSVQSPTHIFGQTGLYYVCVTITDATGCMATKCDSVQVGPNTNCSAQFTAQPDSTGFLYAYQFTSLSQNGVSYLWDFGDGNTATVPSLIHFYSQPGTYTVCLIAQDNTGCMDTVCQTISVVAPPGNCFASFAYDLFPPPGPASPTGGIFIAPYTDGITQHSWDFGDGNTAVGTFQLHAFQQPGTYTVCLYTSDPSGCMDTVCQTITTDYPVNTCKADFNVSYQPDGAVNFDPIYFAHSYHWDFGDGQTGTGDPATHVYDSAGTYTVTLAINDTLGCVDTVSYTVNPSFLAAPAKKDYYVQGWLNQANSIGTDYATTWQIAFDSVAGTLTAVDSVVTTPNNFGLAIFPQREGTFRLKMALDTLSPAYGLYLPTYYGDSLLWNQATVVTPQSFPLLDLRLQPGINLGGPGFIGGQVSQGANRGVGDPLQGLDVLLTDLQGKPLAFVETDSLGAYGFNKLDTGTYIIWVDIPGLALDFHEVQLTDQLLSVTGKDFEVTDTEVRALSTFLFPDTEVVPLRVFPNPTANRITLEVDAQVVAKDHLILHVYNLMGERLDRYELHRARTQLSFETYPPGVYLLKLQGTTQRYRPVRLVKTE
ncbi:MAG: PKD domain-containing protein [Bacteroidota bacterium]